ncbi:hypothetical protein NRB16_07525 [Pseudomonas sp. LJDD11]|uniref:hypothetical protein n=1 Tax=Pseudomonas sp. LJDD11 TaxID=2931984 RepID=UPI00211C6E73|nr:hypothetical protein [Pseudomonas sp. LJDD11]MCQ9423372.1 hypothetical protein [Pseudomonas sp. LJDD11]
MTHPREIIRKQVVAQLVGQTSVGANVFASRVAPLITNGWQNELPAIIVYTLDEQGELLHTAPREYLRTVQLVVEIHASAVDALDDTLDSLARQVENLLLVDDTLGGTVNDLRYASTKMILRDDGDELLGGCRIIFNAEYLDRHPDDRFNASLPDFNTLATDYSLNNQQADAADRATTLIKDLNP